MIPAHPDLAFTVLLLNADSAGNPLEHFSAEEAGEKHFPRTTVRHQELQLAPSDTGYTK